MRCFNTPNNLLRHAAEEAGHAAAEAFDAGATIIGHVANSPIDHPLIHLPPVFGIDMSVTKHVLMLWVAAAFLLIVYNRGRAPLCPPRDDGAVRSGAWA